MHTILTKVMEDNTHLIEDIDSLIRDKKRLESQIDTWGTKYTTLESKYQALQEEKK
jgi:hypothetical protein